MFRFLKQLLVGKDRSAEIRAFREKGAIIVDVRSEAEYKTGHVAGSVNLPLQNLATQINLIKTYNKPVIACCASGRRSKIATVQLRAKGVEAMNGGSWTAVKKAVSE